MKKAGLTLIEILIATVLISVLLLLGSKLTQDVVFFGKRAAVRDDFDEGKSRLLKNLNYIFRRAIKIHFISNTPIPSDKPQNVIIDQGSIILLLDRRPCGKDNKIILGASPTALEQVFMTCCDGTSDQITVSEVPVLKQPVSSPTVFDFRKRTFKPACKNQKGLSIDFADSTISQTNSDQEFDPTFSWCHAGVEKMSAQVVGVNARRVLEPIDFLLSAFIPRNANDRNQIGLFENQGKASKDREYLLYQFLFEFNLNSVLRSESSSLPEMRSQFEWITPLGNRDFDCHETVPEGISK